MALLRSSQLGALKQRLNSLTILIESSCPQDAYLATEQVATYNDSTFQRVSALELIFLKIKFYCNLSRQSFLNRAVKLDEVTGEKSM